MDYQSLRMTDLKPEAETMTERNDIKLHYEEKGAGTTLILLHGNGEDGSYFVHQMDYFSERYRVIALDTRGHGKSPRGDKPFTIRQFAEDLRAFLDEQGIRTLGMIDAGPRNIYTTEEVRTADDFSKLTMRVADVAGLINLFDALNANPTVTAFNEIYTAMQTGVVNGFEIGLESVLSNNLQEVVNYCIETCHTYTIDCILMSERAYQRLTPEEQEIVTRAFEEACEEQRNTFNGNLAGYKEELADAGVETISFSDEEMEQLIEQAHPAILKSIEGLFDESVVEEIRAMDPNT